MTVFRKLARRFLLGSKPDGRALMVHKQAYAEELQTAPSRNGGRIPFVLHYPRSWVHQVQLLPQEKSYDFNFIGGLFYRHTFENRRWIVDYARRHFTENSYYCVTDAPDDYEPSLLDWQ